MKLNRNTIRKMATDRRDHDAKHRRPTRSESYGVVKIGGSKFKFLLSRMAKKALTLSYSEMRL